MGIVLGILGIIVAILLILAVVIQNSKGGGISSAISGAGAATQILGIRRSNEAIEKITWYLAGGLAACAIAANLFLASAGTKEANLRMENAIQGGLQYNSVPSELTSPEDLERLQQQIQEQQNRQESQEE